MGACISNEETFESELIHLFNEINLLDILLDFYAILILCRDSNEDNYFSS